MGIGAAVAFAGTLCHWNSLADAYSSSRYLLLAALVLAFALTVKPKRGLLSVVGIVYMVAITFFSAIALSEVSFIGKRLSYFSGVFPSFLVFACYHYSIGDCWRKIADAFIVACLITSALAIAQQYGLFLPHGDYFGGRSYALIGSPVFLSGVLAMAVPLCLGRGRWMFAVPPILLAIAFTQSRAGILAALVGVLGYYYARAILGFKGLLILSALALFATIGMFASIRDVGSSDVGRYQMTRLALKSIAAHPIIGIGPERFGWVINNYRDAEFNKALSSMWTNAYVHNHILESLVAGGIPFLLIHLLLIGTVGLFAYRVATPPAFGAALALCAFGLMQPTPLLMKCVLASILGALDPSDRSYPRAPFIILALMAFLAALSCVTMAKIYQAGVSHDSGLLILEAYKHQPSALGDP